MFVEVKFKKMRTDAIIPSFATSGSACFDFHAWCPVEEYFLDPGASVVVFTGLVCEIPKGFEMQVRPRSGLAAKKSITIMNSPGTIDSDYRGEIKVILHNGGDDVFVIKKGDRIAQGAVRKIPEVMIVEADELSVTKRDVGGFGSTGV
ncbi:MAG: dUTP diphosphatase [Candidatus Heimdallarchaeaceae archaeon]